MMQKDKILGMLKSSFDASLSNFMDASPTKATESLIQEETLMKIEKLRTLAPAEITEDIANISTALCSNTFNHSSKKAMHVHLVMLIDSLFDLAEFWEEVCAGTRKSPHKTPATKDLAEDDCSLSYTSIYCAGAGEETIQSLKKESSSSSLKEENSEATWKDHDQIERQELLVKLERLERQSKLDSEAIVKAKMKCMDHELLCEENQRLQRAVDELQYKLSQQRENGNVELILAKQEMKELHQRIIELVEELRITKSSFQETHIVSSNQQQDNKQMKQQNDDLELNTTVLEVQIQRLFEEKENRERENITLEEELLTSHAVKAQLEHEISMLQQLLADKERHEAMLIAALQQKSLAESQSKQSELAQQHQTKIIEELKVQVQKKEADLLACMTQVSVRDRHVSELQTEISAVRDSFESNNLLVAALSAKVKTLEEQLELRQHENEDVTLAMESLKNDLILEKMNSRILQDDHIEMSKDKVKLMDEIKQLELRVVDLQRSLEQEKEQNQLYVQQTSQQHQLQNEKSNTDKKSSAHKMMKFLKLSTAKIPSKSSSSKASATALFGGDHDECGSASSLSNNAEEANRDAITHVDEYTACVNIHDPNSHIALLMEDDMSSPARESKCFQTDASESLAPTARFRFSLPTAPQIAIGKLQLSTSFGAANKENTSAKPPHSPFLSFGKKAAVEPDEQQSSAVDEIDVDYDSFEDSDDDNGGNVPDYSYDP